MTFSRFIGCNEDVSNLLYGYDKINRLSLRTVERIVIYFNIIQESLKKHQYNLTLFSVPLCILKVMHPMEYDLVRQTKLTFTDFNNCMRFDLWKEQYSPDTPSHIGERMTELWSYVLGATKDDGRNGQFEAGLIGYQLQRDTVIPYFCRLIDGLHFPNGPN